MENNEAAKQTFDAWLDPFRDLRARRNALPGSGKTDHLLYHAAMRKDKIPVSKPAAAN